MMTPSCYSYYTFLYIFAFSAVADAVFAIVRIVMLLFVFNARALLLLNEISKSFFMQLN